MKGVAGVTIGMNALCIHYESLRWFKPTARTTSLQPSLLHCRPKCVRSRRSAAQRVRLLEQPGDMGVSSGSPERENEAYKDIKSSKLQDSRHCLEMSPFSLCFSDSIQRNNLITKQPGWSNAWSSYSNRLNSPLTIICVAERGSSTATLHRPSLYEYSSSYMMHSYGWSQMHTLVEEKRTILQGMHHVREKLISLMFLKHN